MKTTLVTLCFFTVLTLSACSSGEKKGVKSTSAPLAENIAADDTAGKMQGDRYSANTSDEETANLVRQTLKVLLKDDLSKNLIPNENRKFIIFEYDLNDDSKKEIFVGLIGGYFCGSGGCTMLLLNNQGKVITDFTVTDYPVIIDSNKTKGWKNLIIMSGGKNHLVRYNGSKYPSNPSVQPTFSQTPGKDLTRALDHINQPYPWFKF